MKITTRCGPAAVDGLNEALLAKARAARLPKMNRTRADTTVAEANVAYPTDSGLLACGHGVFNHNLVKIAALTTTTAT